MLRCLIQKQTNKKQDTNDKFRATKVSSDFIARREQALKQLDAGFNSFEEIRGNQKEGMKVNNPFLFSRATR